MNMNIEKHASVTGLFQFGAMVTVSTTMPAPVEGLVVAVEVLSDKMKYNKMELTTGRICEVHRGDTLLVALGNRRALMGFSGDVPKTLAAGDEISLLSLGGVAGVCRSSNTEKVGEPFGLKVLGVALQNGSPAILKNVAPIEETATLTASSPIVIVSGTCMNSGKTKVACQIITRAKAAGKTVGGVKLTGVAALRDTLQMKDAGAAHVASFHDAGACSTVQPGHNTAGIAKGIFSHITAKKADLIVVECGDGIFGEYGVATILSDPDIAPHVVAHIGCAMDPPGAKCLQEAVADFGLPLTVMSGPVTDNAVGVRFVTQTLGLAAHNAIHEPDALFASLSLSDLKKL